MVSGPPPARKATGAIGSANPLTRRQQILELVIGNKEVAVDELSTYFGVSKVTIRGDLESLANQNLVQRTRGGAVASLQQSLTLTFAERALLERDAKQRIARAALELLSPGETVILDVGSTVAELSSSMSGTSDLTVVTPALNIATRLGSLPGVEVVLVGGKLDPDTISCVGPVAEEQLRDVLAHKVFLGAHAVDSQGDLADWSLEVAGLKKALIRSGRQVILLADATKWKVRPAKAKVASLAVVSIAITDNRIAPREVKAMEKLGIRVVVV